MILLAKKTIVKDSLLNSSESLLKIEKCDNFIRRKKPMQILGIYIKDGDENIIKNLRKDTWYGFNTAENLHEIFKDKANLKKVIDGIQENQEFTKYYYAYTGIQVSLNAIVGKNGAGKSTLLDIYNRIINNFSWYVKTEVFKDKYNSEYELYPTEGNITAELFYENKRKIYCIDIDRQSVKFSNNENQDLFADIVKDLNEFSNHFFYTVSTNYSIYSQDEDWINTLYHKNDGYFTPIVLVPFKENGIIDVEKEKKLAKIRVQTLSILLCKDGQDFIEDYVPDRICYELQNLNSYCKKMETKTEELTKFKSYNISDKDFDLLKNSIDNYWDLFFKQNFSTFMLKDYCIAYLKYKTLKSLVNYEVITKQIDFYKIQDSVTKIIEDTLWNEEHLNYINLKIINCKQFMEYTFQEFYKDKKSIEISTILNNQEFKKTDTYDEVFTFLLPDFYETSVYYKYKDSDERKVMQLSDMSSGEQQLYNSLSYIVYHIKNAQSNKNGNKEEQIPYKYFNLIFDEAELYYHPEFQRCFISNLIKLLNRSNLQDQGINITLVTHSPFILSDIPTTNILALETGSPSEKKNETLGANIFDLLQSQFFMTSTIGECSAKIAKEIIGLYHAKKDNKNYDYSKKDFYRAFVQKLGDEYLRTSLGYMLDELDGLSFEEKHIREYKEKIDALEKRNK